MPIHKQTQFVKVEEKKYILIGQIFQGGGPYKV